jgi:hypothetical protein
MDTTVGAADRFEEASSRIVDDIAGLGYASWVKILVTMRGCPDAAGAPFLFELQAIVSFL